MTNNTTPTLEAHKAHEGYTSLFIEASDDRGTVALMICQTCSFIETECAHAHCSWNEAGTTLRCNLCKRDVT